MAHASGDPHGLADTHKQELAPADAAIAGMVDDYKGEAVACCREGEDDVLPSSSALHLLLASPFVTAEARDPRPRQSA